MRAPAWFSTEERASDETRAYRAHDTGDGYTPDDFFPGDRIGAPLAGTRRKAKLRSIMVILIVLGGGWVLFDGQATWPGQLSNEIAAMFAAPERKAPAPVETAATTLPVLPPLATHETTAATAALNAPAPLAPSPPRATALAPGVSAYSEPPATSLTTVDPTDAYQKRAVAAGLHPDLSRVLLARLSPADYRNAGIAIQTAVTGTPDTGVYVWPQQRKPELALFHVRFVAGAAPDCRRYIVEITKDGWLTTALPMEKCGIKGDRPKRE